MADKVSSYSYLQTSSSRISGLASGMDIDSIVEKLMKAESAKMEKLQQQKQKYEWQRDAYRDINTKLESFRTDAFENYKPSAFLTKAASVSDSSRISVTAGTSANGSLNITSVSSLAKVAQSVKDVKLSDGTTSAESTTTLGALDLDGSGTVELKVYQKDGSSKTVSVDYSEDETIDSFVNKLNNSGAGITAIFGNGQLSITSNTTGDYLADGGTVQVLSDTNANGIFKALGFLSGSSTGMVANGSDANYTLNGIAKKSKNNTFTELGYTLTLNRTFDSTESAVTISSSIDTNAIVEKVKSFVELYNGLIESLNTSIKEKKAYSYQPLTEAQKAEMSEDEIEKWEEKAKQGSLRNDTIISSAVNNIRSSVYSVTTKLDTKYNALYNIGITTSFEEKSSGKLSIDEDKLREAIEANPEAVADLFTRAEVKDPVTKKVTDKGGLITQLRAVAKTTIDSIEEKAGTEGAVEDTYTLGETIISVEDRIEDWEDRLKEIEERYYKQFTAMENAISKANSQSSLFMQ